MVTDETKLVSSVTDENCFSFKVTVKLVDFIIRWLNKLERKREIRALIKPAKILLALAGASDNRSLKNTRSGFGPLF
jgi:hypothetical protein